MNKTLEIKSKIFIVLALSSANLLSDISLTGSAWDK
jgi:hypothetical protein